MKILRLESGEATSDLYKSVASWMEKTNMNWFGRKEWCEVCDTEKNWKEASYFIERTTLVKKTGKNGQNINQHSGGEKDRCFS